MSNADDLAPADSSRFGKRLGRIVCAILLAIAVLVGVVQFSGGNNNTTAEQPAESNPFK